MQSLWLVTTPNPPKSDPGKTLTALVQAVEGGDNGRIIKFSVPPLGVGTLDSVIAISDDLGKINTQVENVVRKVLVQFGEVKEPDSNEKLGVGGKTTESFFRTFQWDFAKYQHQGRKLSDLVSQIQTLSTQTDEEVKKLSVTFNEKNVALAALQRKKIINLQTSDFEDFLKPEKYERLQILNSASLLTVFVVVSASARQEFESTYDSLGSNIAAFNNPDWNTSTQSIGQDDGKFGSKINRSKKTGSPVVPGSAKVVHEEGDSLLYTITILKGHSTCGAYVEDEFVPGSFVDYLEPLKHAFREKRFLIREAVYDPAKAGGVNAQIKAATEELKQLRIKIYRWCKANYGEIYSAWVHLKVIKGFVESVLRYGLPLNFQAVFIEPNPKRETQLKSCLISTITALNPQLVSKKLATDLEEEEDDESLPFVCFKFPVIS